MVLNPVISKLNGKLIVLASASPRRLEILTNVGLRFEAVPSWFKETLDKSLFKTPYEYAMETAKQKALEVAERMPFKHLKTPDIVIGADTVVTVDGLILEKPVDKEDAYRMLSRLSGKEHSVFTGVSLVLCHEREGGNTEHEVVEFYEETKVKFAELSEEMLCEYINSGEPMDKAGGYGIQALGGMLVEYIHGDFLNVVGFPLNHFCRQLGKIYNGPPESPAAKMRRENSEGGTNTEQRSLASIARDQTSYSDVFPAKLLDLLEGFKFSKALFTASKLKVFDVLRDSDGLTVEEVATQIQGSVLGTERLLDAAVSLDLLHKVKRGENTVYRNTGQTSQFLVSDSPLSLHEYLLYCDDVLWPMFTHLESAVMQGTNQCEKAFGKKTEHLLQDGYLKKDEVKLRFMKAMHCIAVVAGRDVATAFDLSRFKTACDVGGCTGAMAYEFSKVHPGLSVIVFDLPPVIEMRSEFQPKEPNSRVSFIAGDFFKDSLPKADLYILARILHDWSDEKVHELLDKLSKACAPGCGLLVSEIILNDERTKPRSAHLQALSMTEGRQRSASEYNDLLRKHAFTLVQTHYTGNLLGAMLFVKEEPNTDKPSPLSSAESVETMIA